MPTRKSRPMNATAATVDRPPRPLTDAEIEKFTPGSHPSMPRVPASSPTEQLPTETTLSVAQDAPGEAARLRVPEGSVGLAQRTTSPVRETHKYTVIFDAAADQAFDRLVDHASGSIGRVRTNGTRRGRKIGRSDIVRALLHLADSNIELREVMINQIEVMLKEQEGPLSEY